MVTVTRDIALHHSGTFHHVTLRNADGTPVRCRANGVCKTWKRRPADYQLPVKHGMRDCFYITQDNAADWEITDEDWVCVRRAMMCVRFGLSEWVPNTILRDRMLDEGIDADTIATLCGAD